MVSVPTGRGNVDRRAREMSVSGPGVIGITGLRSFLGGGLAARLAALDPRPRVVGLDRRRPFRLDERVDFREVDFTAPGADTSLAGWLERDEIQTLVHLAFRTDPGPDLAADHELDTEGSLQVLRACEAAKVRKLVVASTTMCYGARADNPNFLSEEHPLRGHPDAHGVADRIETEELVARWRDAHPDVEVTVLRCCWICGPSVRNRTLRYLSLPVVPVPLGYDPLIQLIHEDDVLDVFERVALESHPGVFNVVGDGALPLSHLLRLSGQRALPLPTPLLHRLAYLPAQGQTGDPPSAFYDYLRYLWVADGRRGWEAFGKPHYTTKEAWSSFVSAQRMQRYT